jgi:hypothetical protein
MEGTGEDWAFDCHLKGFSADVGPNRVELPDLLIGHEPLLFMLYLVPFFFVVIFLLTILHESEDINVVLLHISAGRHQLFELVLSYNLGILLKVSTFLDIVFQIDGLVNVLLGQHCTHDQVIGLPTRDLSITSILTHGAMARGVSAQFLMCIEESLNFLFREVSCHNETTNECWVAFFCNRRHCLLLVT